jgi:hypothetical protein
MALGLRLARFKYLKRQRVFALALVIALSSTLFSLTALSLEKRIDGLEGRIEVVEGRLNVVHSEVSSIKTDIIKMMRELLDRAYGERRA